MQRLCRGPSTAHSQRHQGDKSPQTKTTYHGYLDRPERLYSVLAQRASRRRCSRLRMAQRGGDGGRREGVGPRRQSRAMREGRESSPGSSKARSLWYASAVLLERRSAWGAAETHAVSFKERGHWTDSALHLTQDSMLRPW